MIGLVRLALIVGGVWGVAETVRVVRTPEENLSDDQASHFFPHALMYGAAAYVAYSALRK